VLKWAGADEKKWNSLVGSLFQHVRLGPLKFTTSSILPYLKMDYIFDHKTEYTLPDIPSDRLKFKISSIVDYFEFAIPNEALSGTFDKFYLSITEDKVEIRKLAEDDLPPLTGSKRLVREAGHLGPWKKGVSALPRTLGTPDHETAPLRVLRDSLTQTPQYVPKALTSDSHTRRRLFWARHSHH
jgi:hypothetical protein